MTRRNLLAAFVAASGMVAFAGTAEAQKYMAREHLVVSAQAPAGTKLSSQQWVFCSEQGTGTYCNVPAATQVRYGVNDRWITKDLPAGPIQCWPDAWGGDPAWGSAKHCEYQQTVSYTLPPPPSAGPGRDNSADQIAKTVEWVKWVGANAGGVASIGSKDEVPVGDGTFYNLPGIDYNEITSTLYKPYGGKFSNGPYITLYIRSQPWDPFCIAWQKVHPSNMSVCDNWYGQHIVIYL